jgi:phosphodiesterase/alkaline phosphatase D-like protein
MKTGICNARKRIVFQIAFFSLFLLFTSVGNAWSDDSMPTAKTRQVSNVTSSSATLKGTVHSANPSSNVYYLFQWGTTTSYENQTRNQSAGSSADRPEVEVSEELTNLSPNTTYHYRLAVSDGQGQVYGEDNTFTTYAPPTVTTDTATNVTFSSATLIGTVNPNGMKTSVCFYYGPGSGEVNTRKQDAGSGTSPLSASAAISNLRPGTTYYYRMEASSSGGTVSGPQMSFTTPALLPSVTTDDATHVANHTATLNGTINPHETNVSYYFQWGPNENPSAYKTNIKSAGSVSTPVKVSATVGGLKPGTSYYYTIIADYNYRIGGVESRGQANGENRTFTTLISPGAATIQATNVTPNSATLNATVTPNGLSTVWYFEIRKFFTTWKRIGAGEEPVTQNWNASLNISGLDPDSTYRFRIVAKSIGGTSYGPEMNFRTPPFALPIVTTGPAYNITKNSATIEGIVNPRGSPVSYWFQYGPTDSYGKYSTGQSGVVGTSNATASVTITGLIPNTTYHYRLMASSLKGSVYGLDKTFTTPFSPQDVATGMVPGGIKILTTPSAKPIATAGAATKIVSAPKSTVPTGTATKVASASKPMVPTGAATKIASISKPTVTTGTAIMVASTHATIHGTVNPHGLDTMYYFQYCPTPLYEKPMSTSPQQAGNGTSAVNVSADLNGKFTPTNTYHYRIVATNKSGTSYGEDKSFTIPSMLLPAIKNMSPAPASKSVPGARP